MQPKPTRGGARNTGRMMPRNTSGVQAIRFFRDGASVYAATCIGELRRERSINAHGQRGALRQLIELRIEAGMPAPSVESAVRAFGRWRKKKARKRVTSAA